MGSRLQRWITALVVAAALGTSAAPARADIIFGLSQPSAGSQSIVVFDSSNPGRILATNSVTGLGTNNNLVGIDFRPLDNALVGVTRNTVTNAGGVFVINPLTGAASSINSNAFTLTGAAFGVDFNPAANALRIVSDAGQNLRIGGNGAGTVFTDTPLPAGSSVVAAAYTNNFPNAPSTVLYDINTAGQLFIQTPPNAGTLVPVGSLGLGNIGTEVGFDSALNGNVFASVGNALYTINLATGAATPIGTVAGPLLLQDITVAPPQVAGAFVPEPATIAVFGAVAGLAVVTRRGRKKA